MSNPLKRKFNRHARFVLRFDLVTETVSISQDNLNNTADLYKNFKEFGILRVSLNQWFSTFFMQRPILQLNLP